MKEKKMNIYLAGPIFALGDKFRNDYFYNKLKCKQSVKSVWCGWDFKKYFYKEYIKMTKKRINRPPQITELMTLGGKRKGCSCCVSFFLFFLTEPDFDAAFWA